MDERDVALQTLRLKLRAARSLIRDLLAAVNEAERVLSNDAEPLEAERNDHHRAAA